MDEERSAFVYPLLGVKHLFSTWELLKISLLPMAITFVVTVVSIVLLFLFAFHEQAALYSDIMPNWLAHVMAIVMVGMEALVVIFVCVHILFARYKKELYVKVFELEGVPKEEHELSPAEVLSLCCMQQTISLIILVMTMPLNVIPVVGQIVFCLINGPMMAMGLQDGFMLDKGMRLGEQFSYVRHNLSRYLAFGFVAMLLIMIPGINVAFLFTNLIGAALWAVELERSGDVDRFLLEQFNQAAMTDFAGASLVVGGEANLT